MEDSVSSTTGHYKTVSSSLKMTLIKSGPQYLISNGQNQASGQAQASATAQHSQQPNTSAHHSSSQMAAPNSNRMTAQPTPVPVVQARRRAIKTLGQRPPVPSTPFPQPPIQTGLCANGYPMSNCPYQVHDFMYRSVPISPQINAFYKTAQRQLPLWSSQRSMQHMLIDQTGASIDTGAGGVQVSHSVEERAGVPGAMTRNSYQSDGYNWSNSNKCKTSVPSVPAHDHSAKNCSHLNTSQPDWQDMSCPLVRRLLTDQMCGAQSAVRSAKSVSSVATNTDPGVWAEQCVGSARLQQMPSVGTQTETKTDCEPSASQSRQQIYGWQMHRAIMAYQAFVNETRPKLVGGRSRLTLAQEQVIEKTLRNVWNQMSKEKKRIYFEKSIHQRNDDSFDYHKKPDNYNEQDYQQNKEQVNPSSVDGRQSADMVQVKRIRMSTLCEKVTETGADNDVDRVEKRGQQSSIGPMFYRDQIDAMIKEGVKDSSKKSLKDSAPHHTHHTGPDQEGTNAKKNSMFTNVEELARPHLKSS